MKKFTIFALILVMLFNFTGCKSDDYEAAEALYDSGDYAAAASAFAEIKDYKDSAERVRVAKYEEAIALYDSGDYAAAAKTFTSIGSYKDSVERAAVAKIENFASKQMDEYNEFKTKIVTAEDEQDIILYLKYGFKSDKVADFYTNSRLNTFPEWDENYALYSQLIETDSEEMTVLTSRLKTALANIEELRFYISMNLDRNFYILEEIVSRIETLGINDKEEELNKEIMQLHYWEFYNIKWDNLNFDKAIADITIFPDSEVKTIAEEALNLWQVIYFNGELTRERAERALSLPDELNELADSRNDIEQPDYYLKSCLISLADDFEAAGYDEGYYRYWRTNMNKNITPELEDYYAQTTAGKAPIEITGNELYIVPFTYADTGLAVGTDDMSSEIFTFSSTVGTPLYMHYASKPEEARYLINYSGTASRYCTYTFDGLTATTIGYSVDITLYLKDCKTGEILYTQSFSADPPLQINVSRIPSAFYASVSWEGNLSKFLSVLHSTLGIE
jgi:hypothetical protein